MGDLGYKNCTRNFILPYHLIDVLLKASTFVTLFILLSQALSKSTLKFNMWECTKHRELDCNEKVKGNLYAMFEQKVNQVSFQNEHDKETISILVLWRLCGSWTRIKALWVQWTLMFGGKRLGACVWERWRWCVLNFLFIIIINESTGSYQLVIILLLRHIHTHWCLFSHGQCLTKLLFLQRHNASGWCQLWWTTVMITFSGWQNQLVQISLKTNESISSAEKPVYSSLKWTMKLRVGLIQA